MAMLGCASPAFFGPKNASVGKRAPASIAKLLRRWKSAGSFAL